MMPSGPPVPPNQRRDGSQPSYSQVPPATYHSSQQAYGAAQLGMPGTAPPPMGSYPPYQQPILGGQPAPPQPVTFSSHSHPASNAQGFQQQAAMMGSPSATPNYYQTPGLPTHQNPAGMHPYPPPMGQPTNSYQPHLQTSGFPAALSAPAPSQIPGPGAPLPVQAAPTQNAARINTSMVPSPVVVNEADQAKFNESSFVTSALGTISPPLPTTMARYIDDGNASCRFMRLTTYNIPCSEDLLYASRLSLGLIVQPFAQKPTYEEPIPLVDFGPEGPVRCSRCRAYMNPFVSFGKSGRVFLCNICFMQNEVRDSYMCNLDMNGRRLDALTRPELKYGTYDIVAPLDYASRKPSRSRILFVLDSSRSAIQAGTFLAYVETVKLFVNNCRHDSMYPSIGIVTFDKTVQFYDLRSLFSEPQTLVISDILDPFVPIGDGIFADPIANKDMIVALLDKLPKLMQDLRPVDCSVGSAVTAALEALKLSGGRLILMLTSFPSSGLGALKPRESQANPPSVDKVNPNMLPHGDFYRELGKKCAEYSVSVNLVLTPTSTVDLATINDLPLLTSGQTYLYENFNRETHQKTMVNDVARILGRETYHECVAKIRCGAGLQVDLNFGNFVKTEAGDLKFSCLNSEQTFAVTFTYDSKLPETDKICFQCAILYVSADGQLRIRIHNLSLPCTSEIGNVFKMADLDAVVNLLVKQSVSQLVSQPLSLIASQFTTKCTHILAAYRKHCASSMSSGQLVLPDALKLLPLYACCFIKSPGFSTNAGSIDRIVNDLSRFIDTSFDLLPHLLYPRLFALHEISQSEDSRYLPMPRRLCKESIQPGGIYLIENGLRFIIWIGNQADVTALSNIFGCSHNSQLIPNMTSLPELENPISTQVRSLLQKLQHLRAHYLGLTVIRQGLDANEHEWYQHFVEEALPGSSSYVDYLCRIHAQIQQEVTSMPSFTERAAMLNFLH